MHSVILAVPPASLREIVGSMPVRNMNRNIRSVMDQLQVYSQTTVILVYSEAWWRGEGFPRTKRIITNSPLRELWDGGLYIIGNNSVAVLHIHLDVINYSDYWINLSHGEPCDMCIAGQYTASQAMYQHVSKHLAQVTRGVSDHYDPTLVYLHKLENDQYGGARYAWKAGYDWSTTLNDLMKPTNDRVFITGGSYNAPPQQQSPLEGSIHAVEALLASHENTIMEVWREDHNV